MSRHGAPFHRPVRAMALAPLALVCACATAGSTWISEPLPSDDFEGRLDDPALSAHEPPAPRAGRATRVIGATASDADAASAASPVFGATDTASRTVSLAGGRSLGTFRNTYYDFPNETDFDGPKVALKSASCDTIAQVPRPFFESVCVQGSGTLRAGGTVSFAKRDCACAEICPRTQQRICFDLLDASRFPWGRGATGKAITPLLTVAVDTNIIPLGTPIYVPELDGLPRDVTGSATHDGCFIAQDRGVRVKGQHVDVFTGHAAITALWNRLVPSNRGVTVVLDSPRCARAQ